MKSYYSRFQAFSHGRGYLGYKSFKSQELYLNGLLKLADKLFWSPIAAVVFILVKNDALAGFTFIVSLGLITFGLNLRHHALLGFDEIERRKTQKEKRKSLLCKNT
jgi:hypothetical protein